MVFASGYRIWNSWVKESWLLFMVNSLFFIPYYILYAQILNIFRQWNLPLIRGFPLFWTKNQNSKVTKLSDICADLMYLRSLWNGITNFPLNDFLNSHACILFATRTVKMYRSIIKVYKYLFQSLQCRKRGRQSAKSSSQ